MDQIEFRIVSLSYDVHNKVFGIVNRTEGTLSTSINFNFPIRRAPTGTTTT